MVSMLQLSRIERNVDPDRNYTGLPQPLTMQTIRQDFMITHNFKKK